MGKKDLAANWKNKIIFPNYLPGPLVNIRKANFPGVVVYIEKVIFQALFSLLLSLFYRSQ